MHLFIVGDHALVYVYASANRLDTFSTISRGICLQTHLLALSSYDCEMSLQRVQSSYF